MKLNLQKRYSSRDLHVKSLFKVCCRHFKVIVGILGGRVGIAAARVIFYEFHEHILARILDVCE